MSLIAQKLISASGPKEETDSDFNLVTALYHFDTTTDNGNNSTFLDSSSESHTVTPGSTPPTQGSFSPFSAEEGKWSGSFDGTDDYLQIANSADFNLGSGDFTLEAYVFQTSDASTASNSHNIFNKWNNTSSAKSYAFRITSSSGQKLQFFWSTDGNNNNYITSNDSLTSNQWHHVAVVNNGGTITLYIDGTAQSSTGTAGTLYSASVNLNIGRTDADSGSQYFDGFISNARLVKGTAVYTSNFTTPTSPLTAITNTKLLTCCSNRFRDKSTSAHAVGTGSNPKVRPFSPFKNSAEYDPAVHGGSFLFEQNANSSLSVSHTTLFDFGTADYCLEAWLYPTQTSFNTSWAMWASTTNANQYWAYTDGGGNEAAAGYSAYPAGGYSGDNDHILKPFSWNHCVFQNTGGYENWYLNGTRIYNTQNNPNYSVGAAGMMFGRSSSYPGNYFYGGYMSDVRVTTGTNYNPYSNASTLTVPTAPLTKGSYTRLLLNGTNAAMFDQTGSTNIETIGNAQLNTSIKKFGTASAKFDETDDRLLVNNVPLLYAGDFTIEGFVYFNSTPTDGQGLFVYDSQSLNNSHNKGPALGTYANSPYQGKWHSYYGTQASGGTGTQGNAEATPSATTWIHFAYVRTSGVIKIFINGSQIGSDIAWTNSYVANPVLTIGGYYSTSYLLNGYLDSYRVTLKARYTSNFDVPTEAFSNI